MCALFEQINTMTNFRSQLCVFFLTRSSQMIYKIVFIMNALKTKIRNRLEEDHLDLRMRRDVNPGGLGCRNPKILGRGVVRRSQGVVNYCYILSYTGSMFESGDF